MEPIQTPAVPLIVTLGKEAGCPTVIENATLSQRVVSSLTFILYVPAVIPVLNTAPAT